MTDVYRNPHLIACAMPLLTGLAYVALRPPADGGWRTQPPAGLDDELGWDSARCDIAVVEHAEYVNMSVRAFNERYRFARPVVLRGAVDATWPAWQRWTRAELLRRHGARRVKVGRSQALVENLGDGTNATPSSNRAFAKSLSAELTALSGLSSSRSMVVCRRTNV